MNLESLVLELYADTSRLDREVKAAVSRAANQIKKLEQSNLAVKVNEKPLHNLNKLLDVKQAHVRQTAAVFKDSPLELGIDDSQLVSAQENIQSLKSELGSVSGKPIDVKVSQESKHSGDVRADFSGVAGQFSKEIKKGFKSVKQGNLLEGIMGIATSPMRAIFRGFYEGIGITAAQKFASGSIRAIEKEWNFGINALGKATGEAFGKTGKTAGEFFLRSFGVSLSDLESTFGSLGDLFDSIFDEKESKRRINDIADALNKMIVKVAVSGVMPTDELNDLRDSIKRYQSIGKEKRQEIRKKSIENTVEKVKSGEVNVDGLGVEGKQKAVFFMPGFAGYGGQGDPSDSIAQLQAIYGDNTAVIPVQNTQTDTSVSQWENPVKWMSEVVDRIATLSGSESANEDVVRLLSQIVAVREQNPNIEIQIVGRSAGGFIAEQAIAGAKKMGIDVRGVGLGTPIGISPDSGSGGNYQGFMGNEDPIANIASAAGLIGLESGGQSNVNVKGHSLLGYLSNPEVQKALMGDDFTPVDPNKLIQSSAKAKAKSVNIAAEKFKIKMDFLSDDQKQELAKSLAKSIKEARLFISSVIDDADSDTKELLEDISRFYDGLESQFSSVVSARNTNVEKGNRAQTVGQLVAMAAGAGIGEVANVAQSVIPIVQSAVPVVGDFGVGMAKGAESVGYEIIRQRNQSIAATESVAKAQERAKSINLGNIDSQSVVFPVGGLLGKGGKTGGIYKKEVRTATGGDAGSIIPVNIPNTDFSPVEGYESPEWLTLLPESIRESADIIYGQVVTTLNKDNWGPYKILHNAIIKGANDDAIELAAKIIAARDASPDADICAMGHCGGGFVIQEALAIAESAGIENIRGVSGGTMNLPFLASPSEGIYSRFLGREDAMGNMAGFSDPNTSSVGRFDSLDTHLFSEYLAHPRLIDQTTPKVKKALAFNVIKKQAELIQSDFADFESSGNSDNNIRQSISKGIGLFNSLVEKYESIFNESQLSSIAELSKLIESMGITPVTDTSTDFIDKTELIIVALGESLNDSISANIVAQIKGISGKISEAVKSIKQDESISDELKTQYKKQLLEMKRKAVNALVQKDVITESPELESIPQEIPSPWDDTPTTPKKKVVKVALNPFKKSGDIINESSPFDGVRFATPSQDVTSDFAELVNINKQILNEIKSINSKLKSDSKQSSEVTPPVYQGELLDDSKPQQSLLQKMLRGGASGAQNIYGTARGIERFAFDTVKVATGGLVNLEAVKKVTQTVAPAFALGALGADIPLIGQGINAVSNGVVSPLIEGGLSVAGGGVAGLLPDALVSGAGTVGGVLSHVPGFTTLSSGMSAFGSMLIDGAAQGITYLVGGGMVAKGVNLGLKQATKPLGYLPPASDGQGAYNLLQSVKDYADNAVNVISGQRDVSLALPQFRDPALVEVLSPVNTALPPAKMRALPPSYGSQTIDVPVQRITDAVTRGVESDDPQAVNDVLAEVERLRKILSDFNKTIDSTMQVGQIKLAQVQIENLEKGRQHIKTVLGGLIAQAQDAGLNTNFGTSSAIGVLNNLKSYLADGSINRPGGSLGGSLKKKSKTVNERLANANFVDFENVRGTLSAKAAELGGDDYLESAQKLASAIAQLQDIDLNALFTRRGSLNKVGKELMEGLRKGFVDNEGNLVSSISEVAESLPDPLKKILGIASPSKVLAEEVGKPIGQGVEVGAVKAIQKANLSIMLEVGKIVSSVGAKLEGIDKIIAPIMDDLSYLNAVKSGDIDTAASMFSSVAKTKGFDTEIYHGSPHTFNKFDKKKMGDLTGSIDSTMAFFGSSSPDVAKDYMESKDTVATNPKLYSLLLKTKDPLEVDYGRKAYDEDRFYRILSEAKSRDKDSLIVRNVYDDYGAVEGVNKGKLADTYGFFNPNQVKLSDPVTYDEKGRVVPLSSRFDRGSDIRGRVSDAVNLDDIIPIDSLAGDGLNIVTSMVTSITRVYPELRSTGELIGESLEVGAVKAIQKAGVSISSEVEKIKATIAKDLEYLESVTKGDIVKAQSMVEQSAKDSGYSMPATHLTDKDFNEFSLKKATDKLGRKMGLGLGKDKFYFSYGRDSQQPREERPRKIDALLKIQKPLIQSEYESMVASYAGVTEYFDLREFPQKDRDKAISAIDKQVKKQGHDGIIEKDKYGMGQIAVFSPNQIKLSDPVTKTDTGSVVPLSARFDDSVADIRGNVGDIFAGLKSVAGEGLAPLVAEIEANFAAIGDNSVESLMNALQGALSNLENSGELIGESLDSGTRKSLEMNSPSKLYIRHGKNTIISFEMGVEGELKRIKDTEIPIPELENQGYIDLAGLAESVGQMKEYKEIYDAVMDSWSTNLDTDNPESMAKVGDTAKPLVSKVLAESAAIKRAKVQKANANPSYTASSQTQNNAQPTAIHSPTSTANNAPNVPPIPPNVFGTLRQQFPIIDQAIAKVDGLKSTVANFGMGALKLVGLALLTKALVDLGTEAINVYRRFEGIFIASRMVGNGAQYLEKVREQTKALGGDLESTMRSAIQFSTALMGTNLESTGQQLFLDSDKALKSLGLQTQEYDNAMRAIIQISSKGKVSMEELSGQLGEQVPGALQIAADAMQTNVKGLIQMVSSGNLLAEDFVPKFVQQLKNRTAFLAPAVEQSLNTSIGRLGAQKEDLFVNIGAEISPAIIPIVNTLSGALKVLTDNFDALAFGVKSLALYLASPALIGAIKAIPVVATAAFGNLMKIMAGVKISASTMWAAVMGPLKIASVVGATAGLESLFYLLNGGNKSISDITKEMEHFRNALSETSDEAERLSAFEGVKRFYWEFYIKPIELKQSEKEIKDLIDLSLSNIGKTTQNINPAGIDEYLEKAGGLQAKIDELKAQKDILILVDPVKNKKAIDDIDKQLYGDNGLVTKIQKQVNEAFVLGGRAGIEEQMRQIKSAIDYLEKDNTKNELDSNLPFLKTLYGTLEQQLIKFDDAQERLSNGLNKQRQAWISLTSSMAGYEDKLNRIVARQEAMMYKAFNDFNVGTEVQSVLVAEFDVARQKAEVEKFQSYIKANKEFLDSSLTTESKTRVQEITGKSILEIDAEGVSRIERTLQNADDSTKSIFTEQVMERLNAMVADSASLEQAYVELEKSKNSLRQSKVSEQEYIISTSRSIFDFNRSIGTQLLSIQNQFRDYNRQLEDAAINSAKMVRGMVESYQDLNWELENNILTIQNEIEDAQSRLALTSFKIQQEQFDPGQDTIGKRASNIILKLFESINNGESEKRRRLQESNQVQKEYTDTLRRIRDFEEQSIQERVNQRRQIEDLTTGFQNLNQAVKDLVVQLNQAREDLIRNAQNQSGRDISGDLAIIPGTNTANPAEAIVANFGQRTVMSIAEKYGLKPNNTPGNHFGSIRVNGRPGSHHRQGNAVDFGDRMQGVSAREAHHKFSAMIKELIETGLSVNIEEIIWNGHGSPLGDYFATGGKGPFFKIEKGQKVPLTNMGVIQGHLDHAHIAETNRGGDPYRVVRQQNSQQSINRSNANPINRVTPEIKKPNPLTIPGGGFSAPQPTRNNKPQRGQLNKSQISRTLNLPDHHGEYFAKLIAAEAGGQSVLEQALVARSVLNRQRVNNPKAYLAKSNSLPDLINAPNQYQPVRDGSIKKPRTKQEIDNAYRAMSIADDVVLLTSELKKLGYNAKQIRKLLNATGFRTPDARQDPTQNFDRVKMGGHVFNSDRYGRKKLQSNLNFGLTSSELYGQRQSLYAQSSPSIMGQDWDRGADILRSWWESINAPGDIQSRPKQETPKVDIYPRSETDSYPVPTPVTLPTLPIATPPATAGYPENIPSAEVPNIRDVRVQAPEKLDFEVNPFEFIRTQLAPIPTLSDIPDLPMPNINGIMTNIPQFNMALPMESNDRLKALKEVFNKINLSNIGAEQRLAEMTAISEMVGLVQQTEDSLRQMDFNLIGSADTVQRMSKESKGYLTVNEEIQNVVLDTARSYDSEINSRKESALSLRREVGSSEMQLKILKEQLASRQDISEEARQKLISESDVLLSQIQQKTTQAEQLELEANRLTIVKDLAVSNRQSREEIQRQYDVMKEVSAMQLNLANARYDMGGELFNVGVIKDARSQAKFAARDMELWAERMATSLDPKAIEDQVARQKELSEINIAKSYLDAIPPLRDFTSGLKDIILQTSSLQEVAKKLVDTFAGLILDQMVIKPLQNWLAQQVADMMGWSGDITAPDEISLLNSAVESNALIYTDLNSKLLIFTGLIDGLNQKLTYQLSSPVGSSTSESFGGIVNSGLGFVSSGLGVFGNSGVFTPSNVTGISDAIKLTPFTLAFGTDDLDSTKVHNFAMGVDEVEVLSMGTDGLKIEPVTIPNFANGLLEGINKAFAKEKIQSGKQPYLAVLHKGEAVLSTLNGDAQLLRSLKANGQWNHLKSNPSIANYAYGSEFKSSRIDRNSTASNQTTIYKPEYKIYAQDADSFRKSQSQIEMDSMARMRRARR